MKTQPKYKVCRRLGPGIYEKCQTEKYSLKESQKKFSGKRRRPNLSNYAKQLLEKQRVRLTYGLTEKQFSTYVKDAASQKDPIQKLYARLESRLDNVVYRFGLASTRRAARQAVSHGHIVVNGKKIKVPSHQVKVGDVIGFREGSKNTQLPTMAEETMKEREIPTWLRFDMKKWEGEVANKPTMDKGTLPFDLTSVIEFYSR